MSYYSILGLVRDPFVATPDPDLFFRCPHQIDNLERLEISVRLRRGLNVVLGPVGTGKSTLSRHFMRILADNPDFVTVLMLDPFFECERDFLVWLNREFEIPGASEATSIWQLKDNLKNKLYSLGVEQNKTVCLIVDEGQKITDQCMEVLRELLNYETNDYKLLQIVIFAQEEYEERLNAIPNLKDRVYETLYLRSFTFSETMRLITTRLDLCKGEGVSRPIFTFPGYLAVFMATRGFPRKIIQLCHKTILSVVAHEKSRATWNRVWANTERGCSPFSRHGLDLLIPGLASLGAGYLLGMLTPLKEWLPRAAQILAGFFHQG